MAPIDELPEHAFDNTPPPLLLTEPLPWELTRARHLLKASAHIATHPPPHPSVWPFNMHDLLYALPDPMCLESTLPMPIALVHSASYRPPIQTMSCQAPSTHCACTAAGTRTPLHVRGPNGELWLPKEPFQNYDSPSVFGADSGWDTEHTISPTSSTLAKTLTPMQRPQICHWGCWTQHPIRTSQLKLPQQPYRLHPHSTL
jgi:hypothetical protein